MKTLISFVTLTCLIVLSAPVRAQAQTKPTWQNNPMYSVHNYKHANKAAVAQRQAKKPGIPVNLPGANDARLANYKMPMTGLQPVDGVVVPHTPDNELANRNYKRPVSIRPTTDVASKPTQGESVTDDD